MHAAELFAELLQGRPAALELLGAAPQRLPFLIQIGQFPAAVCGQELPFCLGLFLQLAAIFEQLPMKVFGLGLGLRQRSLGLLELAVASPNLQGRFFHLFPTMFANLHLGVPAAAIDLFEHLLNLFFVGPPKLLHLVPLTAKPLFRLAMLVRLGIQLLGPPLEGLFSPGSFLLPSRPGLLQSRLGGGQRRSPFFQGLRSFFEFRSLPVRLRLGQPAFLLKCRFEVCRPIGEILLPHLQDGNLIAQLVVHRGGPRHEALRPSPLAAWQTPLRRRGLLPARRPGARPVPPAAAQPTDGRFALRLPIQPPANSIPLRADPNLAAARQDARPTGRPESEVAGPVP